MRDWKALIIERFARADALDPATETEVLEELTQHFEQRATDLQHSGESPASIDARLEQELNELDLESLIALRRTIAVSPVPMETKATFSGWFGGLLRDFVVGWRSLRRTFAVTIVIAVSLAIVLGANSAIFSLTDAMYLRRLDVPSPEQLWRIDVLRDGRPWSLPFSLFRDLSSMPALPRVAGLRFDGAVATTASGDEQRLWVDMVTGGYFDLVGVKPLVGRSIRPSDDVNGAQVAVVSEDYWRKHLGGRTDVLGQTLRLNSKVFTIVGVMPARYHGLYFAHQFQIAAPFTVSVSGSFRNAQAVETLIGRLDGAREIEAQRTALDAAVRACCADYREPPSRDEGPFAGPSVRVEDQPYGDSNIRAGAPRGLSVQLTDASRGLTWNRELRGRYKPAVLVMVAAALLLLVVVCANVATLLLVRGEWRAREFAIRRSLGASIGRVRRQLFIEALEVSMLGGLLGLFLAWIITTLLARALPPSAHALGDVIAWRPNARVVAVTVGITALCAIASSLWPARRAGRDELATALAGARARGSGGWTGQRILAIGQVSAAMVLISAAWLLIATTRNLTRGAGGYESRDVVLAQVDARASRDSSGGSSATIAALREDLKHLPGVIGAAYSHNAPLMQDAYMTATVELRGTVSGPVKVRMNMVSSEFFVTSGAEIVRGREFARTDDIGSDGVAVVSESFERHYYAGRSALGMLLDYPGGQSLRVVGVARDARYDRMTGTSVDLRDPEAEVIYRPFSQDAQPGPVATLIVRTGLNPATTIQQLRHAAGQRGVQITRATTVGAWLDDGASRERFSAALATSFGALAVLLSAIGVLGVLAFQVARRTKEIGVRMALGAQRRDTVLLVVKQTLSMLIAALAIGAPCAAGAAWLVRSQLYGVAPWDPRALIVGASVILVAGLAASALPSYRAACVDPLIALREE